MGFRGLLALTVVVVIALFCDPCRGDGMVFPAVIDQRAQIPDQQALIVWRDGIETLAIETRFVGTGTEFAWVVPLPSVPEVSPATTGLFPTLRATTTPKLVDSSGARGLCWLLGWLLVLVWVIRFTGGWRGVLLVTLVVVTGMIVILAPALGTARGGADVPGVAVHDRAIVGSYDTATISGKDGSALAAWLTSNGFATPPEAKPVINDYAARGWCFVAAKLRRSESSDKPATPHPLVFKFSSAAPIYPLRLTSVGSSGLGLELYVFGPQAAAAPGLDVIRCTQPRYSEAEEGIAVSFHFRDSERLEISHSGLRALADGGAVVTRLSGRLSSGQMQSDMTIAWVPFEERQASFWSRQGAAATGLCVLLAAMLFGPLVNEAVRQAQRGPVRGRWRSMGEWAVIGAVLGLGIYLFLPKVAVTTGRESFRSASAAYRVQEVVMREVRAMGSSGRSLTLEAIRAALAKEMGDRLPKEEDSPGRFVLSKEASCFRVRTFEPTGKEFVYDIPFEDEEKPASP